MDLSARSKPLECVRSVRPEPTSMEMEYARRWMTCVAPGEKMGSAPAVTLATNYRMGSACPFELAYDAIEIICFITASFPVDDPFFHADNLSNNFY